MLKKILFFLVLGLPFLFSANITSAARVSAGNPCTPRDDICCNGRKAGCPDDGSFTCTFINEDLAGKKNYQCQPSPVGEKFGKVGVPEPIKGFLGNDPNGAGGISIFLSNLIKLFYSVAAIVLIFMMLWGAFEWLTSGGDKEKIAAARGRIINAIIGIILFAATFAVIAVLGQFTGFKFFKGQP